MAECSEFVFGIIEGTKVKKKIYTEIPCFPMSCETQACVDKTNLEDQTQGE